MSWLSFWDGKGPSKWRKGFILWGPELGYKFTSTPTAGQLRGMHGSPKSESFLGRLSSPPPTPPRPDQSKPLDSPAILPFTLSPRGTPPPSSSFGLFGAIAGVGRSWREAAGDPPYLLQLKALNWWPSENEERLFPSWRRGGFKNDRELGVPPSHAHPLCSFGCIPPAKKTSPGK